MELGGGISLEGFEVIEPGKLIVVKKVVGTYTKSISEKVSGFVKIKVKLNKTDEYEVQVELNASEVLKSNAKDKNIFFALDKALASILAKTSQ